MTSDPALSSILRRPIRRVRNSSLFLSASQSESRSRVGRGGNLVERFYAVLRFSVGHFGSPLPSCVARNS